MLGGIGGRAVTLRIIATGARADRHGYGAGVALWRALRATRALRWSTAVVALSGNAAYRTHVAAVAPDDRLFFVTHESYLAKGLGTKQRLDCAVAHYEHEMRSFRPSFHDAVHGGDGLMLWSCRAEDTDYEISLRPGNDVLYEGGLSVVFLVDGQRTAVLSFSRIDGRFIGHDAGPVLFLTRKQLTADHGYQPAFNAAFDRTTPGHLLMAAVTGVAEAFGDSSLAAIRPTVHPGYEETHAQRFDTAYSAFWTSFGGSVLGDVAFTLPLPLAMTPLDELSSKARKRAIARRRHLDAVSRQACSAIRDHLVSVDAPPLPTQPSSEPRAPAPKVSPTLDASPV